MESPLHVLLVEDSPTDAWLSRDPLEELIPLRLRLTHVERLSEARECIEHQAPDVILLDLGLHESQRLETLVKMRDVAPRLPVIILTLHPRQELLKQGMYYSPFTLLAKLCTPKQLIDTVRRVRQQADTAHWINNRQSHPDRQSNWAHPPEERYALQSAMHWAENIKHPRTTN